MFHDVSWYVRIFIRTISISISFISFYLLTIINNCYSLFFNFLDNAYELYGCGKWNKHREAVYWPCVVHFYILISSPIHRLPRHLATCFICFVRNRSFVRSKGMVLATRVIWIEVLDRWYDCRKEFQLARFIQHDGSFGASFDKRRNESGGLVMLYMFFSLIGRKQIRKNSSSVPIQCWQ